MSSFTLLAFWFGLNAIWGARLLKRLPEVRWLGVLPLIGGVTFAAGALYAGLVMVGASVTRGADMGGYHLAWGIVALAFLAWTAALIWVSRRPVHTVQGAAQPGSPLA